MIVWPSEISDLLGEKIGNSLIPPLLESSVIGTWYMSYASTAHINSYLSLRTVLENIRSFGYLIVIEWLYYTMDLGLSILSIVTQRKTWGAYYYWWYMITQHDDAQQGLKKEWSHYLILNFEIGMSQLCHSFCIYCLFCMHGKFLCTKALLKTNQKSSIINGRVCFWPLYENLCVTKHLGIRTT